ncbi:MAG: hypothetical protein ABSC20_00980 [Candidatus Bathyarchaeia archaeon]|jgi:HD superfamily phosphohydrolase
MANNHSISTFLETELGEGFDSIIDPSGYGSATFLVKEFMEKHKDEFIAFWNKQGKDGQAIFDRLYKKWSMTKAEQDALKAQKKKDVHNELVKQYVLLGRPSEEAEEMATAFPNKDPCEVVRIRAYNTQNKPLEEKVETEKAKVEAEKQAKEEEANLKQLAEPTLIQLEEIKNLLDISIDSKAKLIIAKPNRMLDPSKFAEIGQKMRGLNGRYVVNERREGHYVIPIKAKTEPQQQQPNP